ncbi:putative glycoside hydrolase family 15 protein [Echinimonas agarilytica]|uniref:Glycoside hydrolase family 15 protein n=1 Tax=Echinimonas agarilytica TaxID=1215918 RepID=A0AA41W7R4_9GAMM|nr:putative glycoside hydrolase family 15 protein [Echinimonas agarilytica]MCM2680524.1 putative glycoside hydrolase family 15 protein [Echinimonas agarilytica]
MINSHYFRSITLTAAALMIGCSGTDVDVKPQAQSHLSDISERVAQRTFPSAFMAWNPVDMAEQYPLDTLDQRIAAAAKHDLLWEEPISQLSFDTPLVLGLEWQQQHAGLATSFNPASLHKALENRKKLLTLNPNLVMLMEIRWRDAPNSYLPEDSPFWLLNEDGTRVQGWKYGPEPYYMLNYHHPEFLKRIGDMSRLAVESGVYDGIMLDWSGEINVVKAVRHAIGDKALINVNIHDDIEDGELFAEYINGAFMECNPSKLCSWSGIEKALDFFESQFRSPHINGLEVWGERKDLARMRATTTLALTSSNGYVLYGDVNPLPTPDHLHDWYSFWDADLGKPTHDRKVLENGLFQRVFSRGTVIHNPKGNPESTVNFNTPHLRVSDQSRGTEFKIGSLDGDIFLAL